MAALFRRGAHVPSKRTRIGGPSRPANHDWCAFARLLGNHHFTGCGSRAFAAEAALRAELAEAPFFFATIFFAGASPGCPDVFARDAGSRAVAAFCAAAATGLRAAAFFGTARLDKGSLRRVVFESALKSLCRESLRLAPDGPARVTGCPAAACASSPASTAVAVPAMSRPKMAETSSVSRTFPTAGPFFDMGRAWSILATRSFSFTARRRNRSSGLSSSRAPTPYSTAATCLHIDA